jgi:ABC-type microcin C transport system duplicated ATPase subunit YejF
LRSAASCRPPETSICTSGAARRSAWSASPAREKSTVARCIARLIEPSDGAILIEGADVAKLSARALRPHRKRVQIVFQDPYRSLNPRRTVGAAIVEGPVQFRHWRRALRATARAS